MSQFAFADIRGADRRNDYVEGAPRVQAEQVEVGVVPVDLSERAQVLLSAFQDGNSEASSEEINEAGEVHRPRRAPRGEPPEPRERERMPRKRSRKRKKTRREGALETLPNAQHPTLACSPLDSTSLSELARFLPFCGLSMEGIGVFKSIILKRAFQ